MRISLAMSAVALMAATITTGANAAGFVDDFRAAVGQGKTSYLLEVENDSMLLKRDDGLYTSGLRFTQQFALRDASRLRLFGWRLGQELYTSMDINLPPSQVMAPDHPYAGWLYAQVFKQTYHADGRHENFGMDLGCLGPCAGGEWTQDTLHRLIRQPLPQAWSKQVRNEAGVVLHADVAPMRWTPASWFDATPNLHGRFGNIFTDAGAGVMMRAGRLNLLPDEPSLHAYARVDARAVGYNATLQGGYFSKDNPHTVKPKRWVGEAELGVAWTGKKYGITASVVRRSNEINGLPNSLGAENFARVTLSYTP